MKRYKMSRELMLEVDYFITKTDNARHEAFESGDMELLDVLEEKFEKLLNLYDDLSVGNDGVYEVSSKHYVLACECRDLYRMSY